jgi:hypothetical protein
MEDLLIYIETIIVQSEIKKEKIIGASPKAN